LAVTDTTWQLRGNIMLKFSPCPVEGYHLNFEAVGPDWQAQFDIFEPGNLMVRVNGGGPLRRKNFSQIRKTWPTGKYPVVRALTMQMFGIPGED
jgi:hypothetical protein